MNFVTSGGKGWTLAVGWAGVNRRTRRGWRTGPDGVKVAALWSQGATDPREGRGMARRLVDHNSIIEWASVRGARPARVALPGPDGSDPGLRLTFNDNGHSEELLMPISWDEWFRVFDAYRLALVVDDRMLGSAIN